jgi:hypothetical protein
MNNPGRGTVETTGRIVISTDQFKGESLSILQVDQGHDSGNVVRYVVNVLN